LAQRLYEILRKSHLSDRRHELAGNLSHGEQQWLEIGMVLAARPRLILLDEPTAGMTSVETERTADLVKEIAHSATVIVIEHDMQFVRKVAQTVTVLHQGRVLCEGTVEEVESNASVRDVYLGRHEGLARS
jgi:urea transport system ATP-binding protein